MIQRLIIFIYLLNLVSCGAATGDSTTENTDKEAPLPKIANQKTYFPTALNCPKGTSFDYDTFGEGFMLEYCTSCHSTDLEEGYRSGAPIEINLDTPELVEIWRKNILDAATGKKRTMPPSDHVSEEELDHLEEWLECGAPGGSDNIQ